MSQNLIYIPLPKNISFSVFEALKTHVSYFASAGFKVVYLSRNKNLSDSNMQYFDSPLKVINYLRNQQTGSIYTITVIETLIAYFANFFGINKQIIFWVQGLIDQEDYLTHKKKYRFYIYNFLLKKALLISDKVIVVTNHMHKILVKKYKLNPKKKYFVLTCNSRLRYNKVDKIKNSLCYIGGLSQWQNVDKMLIFFNQLLKVNEKYTFFLATFDHEMANKLIVKNIDPNFHNKINLVSVRTKEEVATFLNKMEFGFLIRDNILLNNVASPIKLAEYLSCGVNPIISDSLIEFKNLIKANKCGIVIKNNNFDYSINKLIKFESNAENAVNLYNSYFEKKDLITNLKYFLYEN